MGGRCEGSSAPYLASARASAAFCSSRVYCGFSRSSSTSGCPAVTRSPRSAASRLTLPSASADTMTSSTAAKVPTTSTARRIDSSRTGSTLTLSAASSLLRAAVSVLYEQPTAHVAIANSAAPRRDRAGHDRGNDTLREEEIEFKLYVTRA